MDYTKTVNRITKGFDLTTETGRKKAFMKCMEYADRKLSKSIEYNSFMKYVANAFEQTPIVKDIVKQIVITTGKERLHLTYSDGNGPILTGNKSGLQYLSKVVEKLSESEMAGDHIHFYNQEPPLYGSSYPITVYYENDKWFEDYGADDASKAEASENETVVTRDIIPEDVLALLITEEAPPGILISKNVLYRVFSCEKLQDQKVWAKNIKDNSDRMYIFKFIDDDGQAQKLAVDLDDDEIMFFNESQLRQFLKMA
jgi:hypothetical protein